MPSFKAYLGVARAPFLLLPVTLVAVGAAAAAAGGAFDPLRSVVALLGLVLLHAAVNVLNEWSDYRRGIDLETERTPFSGGSGTLPDGLMGSHTALATGVLFAALGLVAGLWFLVEVGAVMAPILVLGAFAVVAYTDLLARSGLGELFAGLGLGALPVLGAALVQAGTLPATAVVAAIPAFCMTFNLLLLNEFPDEAADRAGGRRNLILLLGRPVAARVYVAVGLAAPLAVLVGVFARVLPWPCLVAMLPSLLLVKPFEWALRRPEAPVPLAALGANVVWNLATNATLALTLAASLWL